MVPISVLVAGQLSSAQDREISSQQPRLQRKDQVWQVYGCPLTDYLLECCEVHLLYMRSVLKTFYRPRLLTAFCFCISVVLQ